MGDDERLSQLGERIAALEARPHVEASSHAALEREVEYLARAVKDVPEVAAASGRQGAISYSEGLQHSFIMDTRRRIKMHEYLLVAIISGLSVLGVRLFFFQP